MTDHSQNTKRIAKNAMYLYLRMLVMMCVSLYTFRKLLELLGVEDYGTYNVVGGVVVMFSFLSTAMTQSNQRFLSFHLGRRDYEGVRKTFSMLVNIQCIIALVVVVLAETIGLWFINCEMNFNGVDMGAVNILYQLTLLTFVIQMFQIPFTSALVSYEKMAFFSYFSIADALLRLGAVLALALFSEGRIVIYGVLLVVVAVLVLSGYYIYCRRAFAECRYRWHWDKSMFRSQISFSGWNVFIGIGNIIGMQGVGIVCNIFYGVMVNAAMGVSHQVSVAINSLMGGVGTAVTPPIIKAYSSNQKEKFENLVCVSSRILYFLVTAVGFPLILCASFILDLWLTDVPEYELFTWMGKSIV